MLKNITLDILINHLGQPTCKIGGEYVWQCPYCLDSHKDNLKYNEQKGLLTCFANPTHAGDVLRAINKQEGRIPQRETKPLKRISEGAQLTLEQQEANILYMSDCNTELLNSPKALNHLLKKRGITKQTVDFCGIGIDNKLHKWVFPIFRYDDNEIIGFEYRPALLPNAIKELRTEAEKEAKKGIARKKGSLSGMAMINCYTPKTEVLAIVEGFLDGYVLFQHLQEQGQAEYYQVVTPSNGISSLVKQIETIKFSNYKKVYLYVDSDETSKPIAAQLISKYHPLIEMIQLNCCKDFNEHYLKCLKKETAA